MGNFIEAGHWDLVDRSSLEGWGREMFSYGDGEAVNLWEKYIVSLRYRNLKSKAADNK